MQFWKFNKSRVIKVLLDLWLAIDPLPPPGEILYFIIF